MRATPLENKIAELAAPVAEDLGFSIVCVNITGEGGARTVQVMAEDPQTGNLGVDDCARLSRSISALLDVEDPVNGPYRLEVSSPGIDRPLIKIEDFERFTGLEAKLETFMPTSEGQKKFRGRLQGIKDGNVILLNTDQGEAEIAFDALAKAKLVLTDELINATARS